MDLHISTADVAGHRTVHVAGRLASNGAAELERVCGDPARLRLDVSELVSADEAGTGLLRKLREAGAEITGTPPYLRLLLRARSGQDP